MSISLELTDMGLVIGCEKGIMSFTIEEAKELNVKLNRTIEEYGYKKQAEINSNLGVSN
ncbi:MAG: hypothetical protein H8D97_00270 [Proteobacteria bacterium]|nr:hypothetical protein [Pseudomonadota bacterium]